MSRKIDKSLTTGVYVIRHRSSGKVYVGSTARKTGFTGRWAGHRRSLRNGDHHSILLQRAWNKYGEDDFAFEVIEICAPEDCITREQFWIDHYQSFDPENGYNICSNARNCLGVKHTEETKAKVAAAGRGRKQSPESIEKMKAGLTGQKRTPEQKERMAEAARNRYANMSPDQRRKLTAAMRTREVRERHSRFMKGNRFGAGIVTKNPKHGRR